MAKKTSQGINVERLNQLILDLGVRVRLYKSTLCPHVKSLESMDADINCSVCKNNMIDFDPKETIAMFQQQELIEQFKIQGTFHMDEILVSFLSTETLAPYTRVDLLDFEEDYFELIQKQDQATSDTDYLKYSAFKIVGLFTVENSVLTQYYCGVDFKLDSDGNIKWIGTHRPADRQIYSVYYKYRPIFRAIKAVHRDRYSQYNLRTDKITSPKKIVDGKCYVKLPETWILKRDYLIERSKNPLHDPNE